MAAGKTYEGASVKGFEAQARESLRASAATLADAAKRNAVAVAQAAETIVDCFENGGTVFFCGNGGSAADAQHLAAEFSGRYLVDRPGLPAIALTTNTSALTAIGNDYGYDDVFARQLESLGAPGDVLVAITTSGKSPSIRTAVGAADALGMTVIALGRGATAAERAAFFAGADAISLHCPLTPETRGLVDAAALAAMRPGALLVNVCRGGVIDRPALVAALADGRLGGVGLDVHWEEPADPADPLYADPRVLALPHVGGSTVEAFTRITDVIVDNLARLTRGEPLRNRVA